MDDPRSPDPDPGAFAGAGAGGELDPGAFASLEPLPGGWSGQTFLGEAGGVRTVVRLHTAPSDRGPLAHEVDAALLGLVRGLLPVPAVLEVRGPVGDLPAMVLLEHLPGERADLLLPTLDDAGRAALGRALGVLAATLAGMPVLCRGRFVDADLRPEPWPGDAGVTGTVEALAARVPGWSDTERTGLAAVARAADAALDAEPRASLVHGDLNPTNVLVDPVGLTVTGLVDWEHAHAGHPWSDLGTLLRSERGAEDAPYAAGVRSAWAERHGTDPGRDLELARCADLVALVDLAARAGSSPVADAAHDLLTAIARSGDVHVVPCGWTPP